MEKNLLFHSKLLKKVIGGYLLFILLPCIIGTIIYAFTSYQYFIEEKRTIEQQALVQTSEEITASLKNCEEVYNQLQQYNNFLRYLNGYYKNTGSQLKAYFDEFQNMFSYAENYSPYIQSICVYPYNSGLLKMNDYIRDISLLPEDITSNPDLSTSLNYGYWSLDLEEGVLKYRTYIRDISMSVKLGILEVTCTSTLITDKLSVLANSLSANIYVEQSNKVYELNNGKFILKNDLKQTHPENGVVIEDISLKVFFHNYFSAFDFSSNVLTITAIVIFFIIGFFSIIYFWNVSGLSKRIVNFSNHISASYEGVPSKYPEDTSEKHKDEFSILIKNYNQMLESNDKLVDQIKLEKLRQHEMAYKILQAQIDPHFIYNALESIRMMAELHNEPELSDTIYSLSQIMRYTFSTNRDQVSLASELDLVEQYLKIQKIRLCDLLEYKIICEDDLLVYKCPQFIIQPLVENAIKYGRISLEKMLCIEVRVYSTGGFLYVLVQNNGAGIEKEKKDMINLLLSQQKSLENYSSGTGIGLDSINHRMNYLYPQSFQIKLLTDKQNTSTFVLMRWNPTEFSNMEETEEDNSESLDS